MLFERFTFITRKQILSERCIYQFIDIHTYLSNILMTQYFFSIVQVSTCLQDFFYDWYKFPFYTMSSVKEQVYLQVSRDLKQCNRVIILSFGQEKHYFTIYQILIPILEGPKNYLIETPPLRFSCVFVYRFCEVQNKQKKILYFNWFPGITGFIEDQCNLWDVIYLEPILHYIFKRLIYMQALDLCHPYILSDEINARTRNETSIVIYNTVAYAPPHLIMILYNHASLAKHVTNESSLTKISMTLE